MTGFASAALHGAAWLLGRLLVLALGLLGLVLALGLVALLIPFCADVSWVGQADGGPGRLRVRAGALGLTLPVFEYPRPAPAPAEQAPAPGPVRRLAARLKARLAAWREARRAKRAAKRAARRPKAPAKPREKAKLTLRILCAMLRGAGRLTRAVFAALRVTRIRLYWPVGGGEPDQAARAYGQANAWLYPALGTLSHFIYMDFEELRLEPFVAPDAVPPPARVSFRVSARALFVAAAAVQVLYAFYKEKVLDVFL